MFDSLGGNDWDTPSRVNTKITPDTPIQAAEQSGQFVKDLEAIERIHLPYSLDRISDRHEEAKNHGVLAAEGELKFYSTLEAAMGEIKEEQDPEIRRTLWEDALDLSALTIEETTYRYRDYLENSSKTPIYHPTEYSGTAIIRESFDHNGYMMFKGLLEDDLAAMEQRESHYARSALEDVVKKSLEQKPEADVSALYTLVASEPYYMRGSTPGLSELPPMVLDHVSNFIRVSNELKNLSTGTPISPELSEALSSVLDEIKKDISKKVDKASEYLQTQKDYAFMTDADIVRRARAVVDREQQSTLAEANDHTQNNLGLLKKAALADAALHGVKIRQRVNKKPSATD